MSFARGGGGCLIIPRGRDADLLSISKACCCYMITVADDRTQTPLAWIDDIQSDPPAAHRVLSIAQA